MPLAAVTAAVSLHEEEHDWRRLLRKRLPILEWLPKYHFHRDLQSDLVAGITVGVMLVPQEMSLAALMNVPPQFGLYSAAIAPLIYPLFGSSKALSVAGAAEGSLLLSVFLQSIESVDERVAYGVLMTFLAGVWMILMALWHQGGVISFFSRTCMNGYVTATGFLIVISQLPTWWGIKVPTSAELTIFSLIPIVQKLPEMNFVAFASGIVSFMILMACKRLKTMHKPPKTMVMPMETDETIDTQLHATSDITMDEKHDQNDQKQALILRTSHFNDKFHTVLSLVGDAGGLLVCLLGILVGVCLGNERLELTGPVTSGFPSFTLPSFTVITTWQQLEALFMHSMVLGLILFMASVAAGSKLAHTYGEEIHPNQELLGVGMANAISSFFHAMPSNGGLSRSAVNAQTAKSPLASVISALLVLITICFLTKPLVYLPKAPLTAIIMTAAVSVIDFSEAKWLKNVHKHELYVWIASFTATLVFGLLRGLLIAILTSLVAIMAKTKKPSVQILGKTSAGAFADVAVDPEATEVSNVVIVRMEQSLYFANATHFIHAIERAMQRRKHELITGAVVDASRMNDIDATALHVLLEYADKLRKRSQTLIFCHLRPETSVICATAMLSQANDGTQTLAQAIQTLQQPLES